MFDARRRDIRTVFERDPAVPLAARRPAVLTPGSTRWRFHRLAQPAVAARLFGSARFVSHISRFLTGIEIHPAARLGPGLFIDHGMGVVIGETAEVGKNVHALPRVSLAGTSLKREKRHPTLGDNVGVGAGAKVIGAIYIGDNSRIGAGSVVVRDVPPNSVVVGVPGRVTYKDGQRVADEVDLNQTDLPDPVARALDQLVERIRGLEGEIETLRKRADGAWSDRPRGPRGRSSTEFTRAIASASTRAPSRPPCARTPRATGKTSRRGGSPGCSTTSTTRCIRARRTTP
jgi:serine O-acetyltransferase